MQPFLALAVSLALAAGASAPARSAHATRPSRSAIAADFEAAADTNATWPALWRRGGNRPTGVIRLDAPGMAAVARCGCRCPIRPAPSRSFATFPTARAPGPSPPGSVAGCARGAGRAGLFVRAIGTRIAPASDDMSGREPSGTTAWTHYEVILPLAPEMERVTFGVRVSGGGTLWADDLRMELLQPGEEPRSAPVAVKYSKPPWTPSAGAASSPPSCAGAC